MDESSPNTPPVIIDGVEDDVSRCCSCCDENDDKCDTVIGGKVGTIFDFNADDEKDATSDGDKDGDGSQEETLLQVYIKKLIRANPKAHTDTIQLQDMVCGWFICPPGLLHTLSCTNSAIFLTAVLKPGNGHFLLAMGRDNNWLQLYLAWAFVKFENPVMWNWFLANLKTALHIDDVGMDPAAFAT